MSAPILDPRDLLGGDPLRHQPEGHESGRQLQAHASRRPWPVNHACSNEFRALRTSGSRPLGSIKNGVVHCTQGLTARGAASWFVNPACRGSAHLVVDELECYRTLPPSLVPWAAPGANTRGWHLELAGFASWTRAEWFSHRGTLERGAFKMALHARAFSFPPAYLTDSEIRRGLRGIFSHRAATRVFGGDHTDPGRWFPWDFFLSRTAYYYREGAGT